jgi:hypothetical protein
LPAGAPVTPLSTRARPSRRSAVILLGFAAVVTGAGLLSRSGPVAPLVIIGAGAAVWLLPSLRTRLWIGGEGMLRVAGARTLDHGAVDLTRLVLAEHHPEEGAYVLADDTGRSLLVQPGNWRDAQGVDVALRAVTAGHDPTARRAAPPGEAQPTGAHGPGGPPLRVGFVPAMALVLGLPAAMTPIGVAMLWGGMFAGAGVTRNTVPGALVVIVGVLSAVTLAAGRLSITPDGVLRMRSFPPWRQSRLRLDRLAAVRAEHRLDRRRNGRSFLFTTLRLRDRDGEVVRVAMDRWPRTTELRAAFAAWAAHARADVDAEAAAYLETGRPAPPEPPP